MKRFSFLNQLFLAGIIAVLAIGCNKSDDVVVKPTITNLEIGLENSKKAYAGADLHIGAQVAAQNTLENIVVEIHAATAGGWEFSEAFTDGITGAKNAEFHEHIDIPATAAPGSYHIHIKVADRAGNVTEMESDLTIEKKNPAAALIFTEVGGTAEGHGDHFHGLPGTEGASDTVSFDETGAVIANGHLHLDPDGIYKISLKTYNASLAETQNKFIADEATADGYKAFLIGGSFVLNANTTNESGAIFQTRETQYANGIAVVGAAKTTGVISYFKLGHANEGEKEVTFIMRKLNAGVKATITRSDWNRADYTNAFAGTNELALKFEIHAEEGHDH